MKADAAVEKVRSHLLRGNAEDGAKLPTERALAETLGVSRNVVRKALAAMEMEGRVVRKVGSGTYLAHQPRRAGMTSDVLDLSPKQIVEARLAVEPNLAAMAAMNCTTQDLAHLTECAQRYHLADDFETYEQADQGFHRAIAMATHNPLLVRAYEAFLAADEEIEWGNIRQRLLTAERRVASRREHDKIVAAIRSRDATAAYNATREHLEHITSALLRP